LRIRPIFHYKKERIRAHILTVFISLVILKYATFLLKDLKISSKALIDNVDTVQIGQLAHPRVSKEISTRVPLNDLMNEVYKRLEIAI